MTAMLVEQRQCRETSQKCVQTQDPSVSHNLLEPLYEDYFLQKFFMAAQIQSVLSLKSCLSKLEWLSSQLFASQKSGEKLFGNFPFIIFSGIQACLALSLLNICSCNLVSLIGFCLGFFFCFPSHISDFLL